MCRKLGAVLIALGVVCVLLAFCLDASASAPKRNVPPGRSVFYILFIILRTFLRRGRSIFAADVL